MRALRQLGGGVIIAIISVVLVLGGIMLSLAETLPTQATPTQIPPTLPLSFPTPTYTQIPALQAATFTETVTASPSPTLQLAAPTSCTPPAGWIRIFSATGDTVYSLAQRYKTSAENLSAANCLTSFDLAAGSVIYVPPVPTVTVIPCGPPAGWVRTHIVQPGDNLYRIALSYGLTYPQLQRANCMGGSITIYTGQRLWVPNIPTRTPVPGVTVVPDFPTETPSATSTTAPATTAPAASTNTATEPPPTATATIAIPTETPSITAFPSVQAP